MVNAVILPRALWFKHIDVRSTAADPYRKEGLREVPDMRFPWNPSKEDILRVFLKQEKRREENKEQKGSKQLKTRSPTKARWRIYV